MSNWKSFKESKPEEQGPYLVTAEFQGKRLMLVSNWVLQGDSGFWYGCNSVSHWMDLPCLPIIETIQ